MNKSLNSQSKDSLHFFINCSESRVTSLKQGQKLLNAANFQTKVFKMMRTKDYSDIIKILPKNNPLAKSISPTRQLQKKNSNQFHSGIDNPFYNYERSAALENKKLENLESFFKEKFHLVSRKMKSTVEEVRNERDINERSENRGSYDSLIEESPVYVSRVKKDLIKTDEEVQEVLDDEERRENYKEEPFVIEYAKSDPNKKKSYLNKFTVLSRKAVQVFKNADSNGRPNLSKIINSNQREDVKFPAIKKSKFFDPTPVPPSFQISRDLIIPQY